MKIPKETRDIYDVENGWGDSDYNDKLLAYIMMSNAIYHHMPLLSSTPLLATSIKHEGDK